MSDTATLRRQDNFYLHPWENIEKLDTNERTIISRSEGIYVYDSDGNRLIDGPAGMWCVNAGHGRREIADAMAKQALEMPYFSPWSVGTPPSGQLAEKLAELAPGDLNHVFFTTGGSTAVDSALRFTMFYNNYRGRPEKKHIISRQDAYHGSTYLSASASGKTRDKNYLDFETGFVHLISSPHPKRRPAGMTAESSATREWRSSRRRSWKSVPRESPRSSPSRFSPREEWWCRRPATTAPVSRCAAGTMSSTSPTRW